MEIFNKLISKGEISIAFGFFDGVHIGHKKVIKSCINYARSHGIKSAVLTFAEHPCVSVWNVKPQYIITKEQRINAIKELGVDYLYIIDFDKRISELSPENFLKNIHSSIAPNAIFTGFNFMFGKNKSGNKNTLKMHATKYEYKYFEIPEQKINNTTISSTNIRTFLKQGKISKANNLLGYEFNFSSKVYKGNKIGRTIDFPTVNLKYSDELIDLKFGVYSAKIAYNGKIYNGIMNYGFKPTFNDNQSLTTEVHILNFNKVIYGENIYVKKKNLTI